MAGAPGDGSYSLDLLPGLLLFGLGVTAVHVPLTARAGEEVPAGEKGIAYGIFETCTHVGGVVILTIVATTTAAIAGTQRANGGQPADGLASGLQVAWIIVGAVALVGAIAVLVTAPDSRSGGALCHESRDAGCVRQRGTSLLDVLADRAGVDSVLGRARRSLKVPRECVHGERQSGRVPGTPPGRRSSCE